MSQDPCAHVDKRMKATRNSYYALQGMCKNGCSPEAMSLLFKMVIQPCLTHGLMVVQDGNTALHHTWDRKHELGKLEIRSDHRGLEACGQNFLLYPIVWL